MGYNLTENLFGYTLVQDILVETATTSVTFSGLNYTAADDLLLVSDINNGATGGCGIFLTVNNNDTTTNYYFQELYAGASSVSSARLNQPRIASLDGTSTKTYINTEIKITNNGYFVSQTSTNRTYGGSGIVLYDSCETSTFTISSINTLKVIGEVTNAIGIGSRFRLYKLNATKVADITVGTATTSVDITGLNITKDSEYMLVSFSSNPTASTNSLKLYVNGNTTDSNYWNQHLYADSTSVGSSRVNSSPFMYTPLNGYQTSMAITNLKLTNNGNFVYQSDSCYRIGGSSIEIDKENGTSTFTTSSITQLTITASVANSIGIGSRFQLYRMKG